MAAAWAQPLQAPTPQTAVPRLIQANQLINDYGNLRMFAADKQKVMPPMVQSRFTWIIKTRFFVTFRKRAAKSRSPRFRLAKPIPNFGTGFNAPVKT